MPKPIPFSSFGGYRRFCDAWWKDLLWWLTKGWLADVRTYWQRARYGFAARDTWSLDHHIARVLAGSLKHLADATHGTPNGYPERENIDFDTPTDHDKWRADLSRWADSFDGYVRDDYYEIHKNDYQAWNADEKARSERMHLALREMEPWFEALWD